MSSEQSHFHPTVEITMGGQKSQAKLTRTQSSLLRSSPTVRSSIQSFPSVNEVDLINSHHSYSQLKDKDEEEEDDEEALKKNNPPPRISGSKSGSIRFTPVYALTSLSAFTLFSFFLFYINREEIPTSENLLVALVFIAVTLFFASKNKTFINHTLTITRQKLSQVNTKLLLLSPRSNTSTTTSKGQIKWLIGETNPSTEKSDRITREGVEFYSNGDFYEGEFHKGRCNGSGVYNYIVNGRYEGDWVDGRYDGYGIESWARGSKYRGQYRQGLRHGYGVYRFFTGDSYAGEWCNGQSHGVGAQTCADGSCYVGEFKCALKHGLGCYYFRNGDRYAGEYFGDKIHGFGVYHFANGHCYEGSWHEGRKQGYGMYTFRNSDTQCGEWDAGHLKTHVPRLTDAVLRAVQAARKNARNAINIRGVEEQVKKAAMAANRAATAARVAAVKAVQNRMVGKFCDTDILG